VVKQRINSAVQIKVLLEPMNNPLGVSPSKGNQETTRGKEKIFLTLVTSVALASVISFTFVTTNTLNT